MCICYALYENINSQYEKLDIFLLALFGYWEFTVKKDSMCKYSGYTALVSSFLQCLPCFRNLISLIA